MKKYVPVPVGIIVVLCSLLSIAGVVQAETFIDWSGGGADALWRNPLNWAIEDLPIAADSARIAISPGALVDGNDAIDLGSGRVYVYDAGILNITGGTIRSQMFYVGHSAEADAGGGTVNLYGGTVTATRTGGAGVLVGNSTSELSTLNVAGGTLTAADVLTVGHSNPGQGIINVSNSGIISLGGEMRVAVGTTTTGVLNIAATGGTVQTASGKLLSIGHVGNGTANIDGGSLIAGGTLALGHSNAVAIGTLNMHAGTATATNLYVGNAGVGHLIMTGGQITITDAIALPAGSSTGNSIELQGGEIIASSLTIKSNSIFNITDGVLKLRGNKVSSVQSYANAGLITGFGTARAVLAAYDAVNDVTTVTASFELLNRAYSPSPSSGSSVDIVEYDSTILSWFAGDSAVSHDVYFGTDYNSVANATTASAEYKGNAADSNYAPGALQYGTSYYWRVDEVNTDNTVTKGVIWSLGLSNNTLIDNFESYNTSTSLISAIWTAEGHATVDLGTYNSAASNALRLAYSNGSGGVSAASRQINWASIGLSSLSMLLHGDPANTMDQLYAELGDLNGNLARVYFQDFEVLIRYSWEGYVEWNISLADFQANNPSLDLANITTLRIGVGGSNGAGIIYVDNIRAYIRRCIPAELSAGDINRDCSVDYKDLQLLAANWLVSAPFTTSDANLVSFPTDNSQWVSGKINNALHFAGGTVRLLPNAAAFDNFYDKTITFWANADTVPTGLGMLFKANYMKRFYIMHTTASQFTVAMGGEGSATLASFGSTTINPGQWYHLAVVVRKTGERCEAEFYIDGVSAGKKEHMPLFDKVESLSDGTVFPVVIGGFNDSATVYRDAFIGSIDDWRLYNAALSNSDIALLANQTGEPSTAPYLRFTFDETSGVAAANSGTSPTLIQQRLNSSADAFKDNSIDLKDFAIIGQSWLADQLWP